MNKKRFASMALLSAFALTAIAAGPVTLDYAPGAGSRSTIRGTNKTVKVDSRTGTIDIKDKDLVDALDCKADQVIVCDPASFPLSSPRTEPSVCNCVDKPKPVPPVTGAGT